MIGPDQRGTLSDSKDASLWFNVDTVYAIIEVLKTE